jgi:uracil-DNA glycosylase
MSDAARHRLRLWLRSERALGLTSVAARAPLAPGGINDEAAGAGALDSVREAEAPDPAVDCEPVRAWAVPQAVASPAAASTPGKSGAFSLFADEQPTAALVMPSPEAPAFEAPPLSPDEKRQRLIAMDANEVSVCTRCRLCETRTKTVFGEGDADARIFFIGEGPGENEDRTGRPFVGKAGQLLDRMIGAMGLRREQVFIANVVKCRPPGNREPAPDEVATCTPYLVRQLEIVRPSVIVTLGRPATQYMLQTKQSMSRLRGQWQQWRGIRLMPTFHPAYVLRQYTEDVRAAVWGDLKKVMAELGLPAKGERA